MTRNKAKRNFTLAIAAFFAVHTIASFNDLYRSMAWVDIPAHFLSGVFSAAFFYWFFQYRPSYFDTSRNFGITLVLVLGWVTLIGVGWEFFEYLYDLSIVKYGLELKVLQFGLVDTLGDLLFDMLGGAFLAIFVKLRYHR